MPLRLLASLVTAHVALAVVDQPCINLDDKYYILYELSADKRMIDIACTNFPSKLQN